MLVSKTKGTLEHRDISAEYTGDGKYRTLRYGTFIEMSSPVVIVVFAISVPLSRWPICVSACRDWEEEGHLDITSPTFSGVHLHYHVGESNYSFSAASPAIGTVALDSENDNDVLKWNFYYRPQVSPTQRVICPGSKQINASQYKVLFRLCQTEGDKSDGQVELLLRGTVLQKLLQQAFYRL